MGLVWCGRSARAPTALGPNCMFSATISVLYLFTPSCPCHERVCNRPSKKAIWPLRRYLEIISARFLQATTVWNSTCSCFSPVDLCSTRGCGDSYRGYHLPARRHSRFRVRGQPSDYEILYLDSYLSLYHGYRISCK